jgi:hypothetical protein
MKHSTANVSASQLRSAAWETCALSAGMAGIVGSIDTAGGTAGDDRLPKQGYPTCGTPGFVSFTGMAINPEAGD